MVVAEEAGGRWWWFTFFIEVFKTTLDLDLDFPSDDDIWTRVCNPTTINPSLEVVEVELESWEKPPSISKGFLKLKFLSIPEGFLNFEGKKEKWEEN